ncbi:SAM-dependent methyltransferase [Planomonospora sp. ID82291]|uniref:SAM-dependent methyltransferase n=1 Tax=Planomonospora sp. ID82291 TaxID=2738136 RepID=UPI0018C41AC3|nr:SAM-dependent methyltransferase [Planomonospora sp. ID82291]MBG0818372.1 SAM-dependent methyltransferase [Planomonospora sp. ID82291]
MISGEAPAPTPPRGAVHSTDGQRLRPVSRLATLVAANKRFLMAAAVHLAGLGVEQFLQVPSGLLASGGVHEAVQRRRPAARVAYLDDDPVVLSKGRGRLDPAQVSYALLLEGRLSDPHAMLDHAGVRTLLDRRRPIAVVVNDALPQERHPQEISAVLRERLAPGSYLVATRLHAPGARTVEPVASSVISLPGRRAPTADGLSHLRALLEGWTLLEPGLFDTRRWRPGTVPARLTASDASRIIGGIGRLERS